MTRRKRILAPLVLSFLLLLARTAAGQDASIVAGKRIVIHSNILNEDRELRIATPASYDSANDPYPVLFVLDGESHFLYTAGVARYLALYGAVPEMIVVGVSNVDRVRDYTPSPSAKTPERYPNAGGSERYLRFIRDEVVPYVEKNYRTMPYRVLAGHSLGGLCVMSCLASDPDLFSAYVAISPSIGWNDRELFPRIEELLRGPKSLKKFVFLSCANEGPSANRDLYDLKNVFDRAAIEGLVVEIRDYPEESHGSSAIVATSNALSGIFAGWVLSEGEVTSGGLEGVKRHYEELAFRLGFAVAIPEQTIDRAGYAMLAAKKFTRAIELFQYNVEHHPESWNVYDSLAEAYMKRGDERLAAENYGKSLRLNPDNANARQMLERLKQPGR